MIRRTIGRAAEATQHKAARAARGIVLRWLVFALGGVVVTAAAVMTARTLVRRRADRAAGPAPDAFGAGVRAVDETEHLEPGTEPGEQAGAAMVSR